MARFKWSPRTARALDEIIVRCWTDARFKRQFVSNPRRVLGKAGVRLPADLTPVVISARNSILLRTRSGAARGKAGGETLTILLPPRPPELARPRARTARARRVTLAPGLYWS